MDTFTKQFPVVLEQELIWRDMDAYQHINNAVYFRYFEDARIAWFQKLGVVEYMEATGVGPILASTQCDFRLPLTFPDRILIGSNIVEVADKRFKMKYAVYSDELGKVVAEGEGLIVYYDYRQKKSCRIPETIRLAIDSLRSGH